MNIPLRVATAIREELGMFEPEKKKEPSPPLAKESSNKSVNKAPTP
jgi:hypothetical protein